AINTSKIMIVRLRWMFISLLLNGLGRLPHCLHISYSTGGRLLPLSGRPDRDPADRTGRTGCAVGIVSLHVRQPRAYTGGTVPSTSALKLPGATATIRALQQIRRAPPRSGDNPAMQTEVDSQPGITISIMSRAEALAAQPRLAELLQDAVDNGA